MVAWLTVRLAQLVHTLRRHDCPCHHLGSAAPAPLSGSALTSDSMFPTLCCLLSVLYPHALLTFAAFHATLTAPIPASTPTHPRSSTPSSAPLACYAPIWYFTPGFRFESPMERMVRIVGRPPAAWFARPSVPLNVSTVCLGAKSGNRSWRRGGSNHRLMYHRRTLSADRTASGESRTCRPSGQPMVQHSKKCPLA